MTFSSSNRPGPVLTRLNIHAPAEMGKTTIALMVGGGLQTWPPAKGLKITTLAHVGWDEDSLAAVRAAGAEVTYHMDMFRLMTKPRAGEQRPFLQNPEAAMEYVVDQAGKLARKDSKVTTLINDTESIRNAAWWAWLLRTRKPATARDKQRLYGELLDFEGQYLYALRTCGIPVLISLFHTKVLSDMDDATVAQKVKTFLMKMGKDEVSVGPDMNGGGIKGYTNAASLEVYLTRAKNPKTNQIVRHVISGAKAGGKDVPRTKSRFQGQLPEKLEVGEFVKQYRKLVGL